MPVEPVPMCLFIPRSGVQLSHPHPRVWILWSRLDCKCGCVCLRVLVSVVCTQSDKLSLDPWIAPVQAQPDRPVTRLLWRDWMIPLKGLALFHCCSFFFLLHLLSLLCKQCAPVYQTLEIPPVSISTLTYFYSGHFVSAAFCKDLFWLK